MSRIVPFFERHRELVLKHAEFYRSLDSGARVPRTPAQQHFVAVCRGRVAPMTEHEHAFIAFRALVAKSRLSATEILNRQVRLTDADLRRPRFNRRSTHRASDKPTRETPRKVRIREALLKATVPDTCTVCKRKIRVLRTDQHNYCSTCRPPRTRVSRAFLLGEPGLGIARFGRQVRG